MSAAPKETRLHIRASEAQMQAYKAAAEARSLTVSAWARMVLAEASAPQDAKKTRQATVRR